MEIHEEEHILRCTEMFNQYEEMIESLSQNIQFYQEEVHTLKEELNHFIQQNKELSLKLQEERKANLLLESFKERDQFENNIINSLKSQLDSTLQENRTITELWQSSLKTIDCLEQELNIYRADNDGFVSQRFLKCEKEKYDQELQSLHSDLQNLQEKLKETIQLHTDALKAKNEELYLVSEENKNVKQQIDDFKSEMNELRKRQIGLDSIQERFTQVLNEKLRQIDNYKKNEAAIKIKMNEALVVAERAVVERDAAILRETQTKNEVEKLSQYFEQSRKEMDLNMANQIKDLEKLYEEKGKVANEEIKALKDELATKSLQLEKFKNECEILHEEVKRIRQGNAYIDETNTSRLLILEKNMEATFQKLKKRAFSWLQKEIVLKQIWSKW
ncbi:golgin subfamily A member 5-like isoform X2 [Agrilus planipennis]|uniref:Golgin subfamily A member 5-like isoform X2 n=1 Tax=Agrilus planipennis TaxID=224129 RepID=A0A1W4X587_AGRPL|nr:golgin subfamily A member 5-like isoform X2 [Agrilus planipennis]